MAPGNWGLAQNKMDPKDILSGFARELIRTLNVHRVDVFVWPEGGTEAGLAHTHSVGTETPRGTGTEAGETLLHRVLQSRGDYLLLGNIKEESGEIFRILSEDGMLSCLALPLAQPQGGRGVVALWSRQAEALSTEDIEVLRPLADQLAIALSNASLFARIEAKGREWQQTFDSMSEGVAIITPDHLIARANKALARMVGIAVKDLVGQPCYRVVHGLDAPLPRCLGCACLATGVPGDKVYQEDHLGGRWLHSRADPVLADDGRVISIVHTFADVTDATNQRLALERIHGLSNVLSSSLDPDAVLAMAVEHVAMNFDPATTTTGIALLDEWGLQVKVEAVQGRHAGIARGLSLPAAAFSIPASGEVSDSTPLAKGSAADAPAELKSAPGFAENESFAVLPLVVAGRAVGVLFVASTEPGLPGEMETLLSTSARAIAMAVTNAMLFRQTDSALRRKVGDLQTITDVLAAASQNADLDTVLHDTLQRVAGALQVDAAALFLVDDSGAEVRRFFAVKEENAHLKDFEKLHIAAMPLHRRVVETREWQAVHDVAALPEGVTRATMERLMLRSVLVVPLVLGGKVIGTLDLATISRPKKHPPEKVNLACAVAGHLATVVENLRLRERTDKERATLESIVASMGEGLVVVDREGQIIYYNRAAEPILDLSGRDFLGRDMKSLKHALARRVNEPEALGQAWTEALGRLGDHPVVDFELGSARGKRTIEATFFAVGEPAMPKGTGILLRDVSREREVDRMKTEFISIASHELRTPLTAIYGFAELLLLRSSLLAAAERRWIETIHKESKRLSDIVDDLLNISRIEAGRLSLVIEPVAIPPLADSVIARFEDGRQTHSLSRRIADDLPEVAADRDKLLQVLYNLVDNAIKYSPGGGEVAIRAEEAGNRVVVAVSDHGLGIPEDEIPKLFTRFHRVHRPETLGLRGTGLGLYIVRSLVEMMGGTVWVESKVNEGSTFSLSLPTARTADGEHPQ